MVQGALCAWGREVSVHGRSLSLIQTCTLSLLRLIVSHCKTVSTLKHLTICSPNVCFKVSCFWGVSGFSAH
ncbi:hypothetical protein FKM82_029782 [Ascaphus truei]